MGQGQSSPIGAGIGGVAGIGGPNVSANAPGDPMLSSGFSTPVQGGAQGGGFLQGLAKLLKDPEVVKALGGFATSIGGTMAAGAKIPDHAKEMMQQLMQQGQQHFQPRPQGDTLNPYGGDMSQFITPEMARGVLDGMGIPYGRIPN